MPREEVFKVTVTSRPPGQNPVLSLTAIQFGDFFAYGAEFRGGVNVAAGDFDGDGKDEIITGPASGGGPHVKVWRVLIQANLPAPPTLAFQLIREFFAFDSLNSAATVAAGDVTLDLKDEIIVGMASNGSDVSVWADNPSTSYVSRLLTFTAYPNFSGGVNVAGGDIDIDPKDEIITGAGPGGGPHVRIWDMSLTTNSVSEFRPPGFFAYDTNFQGGVAVGAGNVDGNPKDEVITGAGAGGGPHVKAWRVSAVTLPTRPVYYEAFGFMAYDPGFSGGVNVASGDFDQPLRSLLTVPKSSNTAIVVVRRTRASFYL